MRNEKPCLPFRMHRIRLLASVVLMLLAVPAFANYSCRGTVNGVTVAPDGTVVLGSSSMGLVWVYLCNINTNANGVSPESCKGMLGVLLSAQTTGRQVEMWFNDNLTCTTHPRWAFLTGWYFDPTMWD